MQAVGDGGLVSVVCYMHNRAEYELVSSMFASLGRPWVSAVCATVLQSSPELLSTTSKSGAQCMSVQKEQSISFKGVFLACIKLGPCAHSVIHLVFSAPVLQAKKILQLYTVTAQASTETKLTNAQRSPPVLCIAWRYA